MATLQSVKAELMARGLSEKVASAIAGNLATETDNFTAMRPYDKTENSYGWAHWNGPRLKAFKDYAAEKGLPIDSDKANAGYLIEELNAGQHVPKSLVARMEQAPSVASAATLFRKEYERPRVANDTSRIRYAEKAYNSDITPTKVSFMPGESYGVPNPPAGVLASQLPPGPPTVTPVTPAGEMPLPIPANISRETPEEQRARAELAYEMWKKQMDEARKYQSTPKDMSNARMGLVGLSNPGYQDVGDHTPNTLQGLMSLLLSGKLGGQPEYTNFIGG